MRRNFDLVREILIAIADQPAGSGNFSLAFPGEYEDVLVLEHLELLIEAGLVDGVVSRSMDAGIGQASITRLTWAGQDFIAAIESDSNWSKVKAFLAESGKLLTIEAIKFAVQRLFGVEHS